MDYIYTFITKNNDLSVLDIVNRTEKNQFILIYNAKEWFKSSYYYIVDDFLFIDNSKKMAFVGHMKTMRDLIIDYDKISDREEAFKKLEI